MPRILYASFCAILIFYFCTSKGVIDLPVLCTTLIIGEMCLCYFNCIFYYCLRISFESNPMSLSKYYYVAMLLILIGLTTERGTIPGP